MRYTGNFKDLGCASTGDTSAGTPSKGGPTHRQFRLVILVLVSASLKPSSLTLSQRWKWNDYIQKKGMVQELNIEEFKGQARLPRLAVPKHYNLHLRPDLSACTFAGSLRINLVILENTKVLVLNALELAIHKAWFTNSHAEYQPCEVLLDGDDEILVLGFKEALGVGPGVLEIEYSGVLNNHLKGFYKCKYVHGGQEKTMAVTQFEAVDARRCFPCWDEPALKAIFKITVDVQSELTAISNMPIADEKLDGNIKTVHFEASPVMSTYLVALVIGIFDHIEGVTADGTKVRVYCPVGKSDKGKLSLDIAVKSLNLFTKYFSMPYSLPKMDMVAVSEFSGGAMENYGLIIYRENELLYDDQLSTAAKKQIHAIVGTHEVAHQWFGNMVTMEWWTHLWLNEGFATWISYMATDSLYPEWDIWTQFLEQTAGGLHLDALEQSHPIEVEVNHARSIDEIFDAISYKKGSAVIRMLQSYLGDDMFQKCLSSYIKRYAWKNAKTEDLWSIFSEESGDQVNTMMDSWTKQKGYPVITVKYKDYILKFEQSQFLLSGLGGEGQWIVPITLAVGSYNNQKKFLLETKTGELDISELVHSSSDDESLWVKVNVEHTGFYRVKYDDELEARLRKALEHNCLAATDKFGILDDAYALCVAGKQTLSSLLSLMNVYRKDLEYIVVSKLINVCYGVLNITVDAIPNLENELKQFFTNLLQFSARRLGWESVSGESHSVALLRGEILMALATFDPKTQQEAMQRFWTLLSDRNTTLLSANTKRAAYIAIMRNASSSNRSGFESLLNMYREADAVQEKELVLRVLASCPDPDIVLEVLNFLVSDEVRSQDVTYGLRGLSIEGREPAWKWLKENWDRIHAKYGSAILLTHFITNIVTPFSSHEKAEEIEEFFASRANPSIAMNLKQSIEQVRTKARWAQDIKQEQSLHHLLKLLASKE